MALKPQSAALTAIFCVLSAITSLTTDTYLPALPAVAKGLAVDRAAVQWTLNAAFLGFAAGQLLYGSLSDRWGRRPVLIAGLIVYTIAGIGCAMAPNIAALIAARAVQGFAAAAGIVLSRAMIRDLFEGRQAARVFSIAILGMTASPLLAPIIGTHLSVGLGWRAVFVFLAAYGLIALLLVWPAVGESLTPANRAEAGFGRMMQGFASVLVHRIFLGYALAIAFSFSGMFCFLSSAPYLVTVVYGAPAGQVGYWLAVTAAGFAIGSLYGARAIARQGITILLRRGLGLCVVSAVALTVFVVLELDSLAVTFLCVCVYFAGIGLAFPQALSAALIPFPHLAGTAAAVTGAVQMLIAVIIGGFMMTIYNDTAMITALFMLGSIVTGVTVFVVLAGKERIS